MPKTFQISRYYPSPDVHHGRTSRGAINIAFVCPLERQACDELRAGQDCRLSCKDRPAWCGSVSPPVAQGEKERSARGTCPPESLGSLGSQADLRPSDKHLYRDGSTRLRTQFRSTQTGAFRKISSRNHDEEHFQ